MREQAALGVDIIKVWVDDRMGQYPKLAPEIYGAVIEEAHANGLRTTAHEYYLADAKELVRRGIDAFAHTVREPIDDEFVAMLKERPSFVVVPNLPDRGVAQDMSWLASSLPADQVAQLQAAAVDRPEAQAFFAIQARNLERLSREGVKIALGTDGNVPWGPHLEMADMVATGMTPAQVIVASTGDGGGVHAAHRRRHGRAGQGRELHRARRESARRHHQHAAHSRRVLARRAHRSLGVLG